MATSVRSIFDMNADKVRFRGVGISFTATAGTATSYDYLISEGRIIDGTQIILKDHAFGDHVAFKIVDVDNMFGYGAGVVLETFGDTWYVASDKQDQGHIRMPYSAEIIAGLYIRVVYTSVGATNVGVKLNLFVHKYLA